MALITPAQYARYRGVSRQAIDQAIDAGRIPTVDDNGRKKIDPKVADATLETLTDFDQQQRALGNQREGILATATVRAASADADAPASNGGKPTEAGARGGWIAEKIATERIKSELLALELAEKRGELLRKEEIEKQIGPLFANLRNELLLIPARLPVTPEVRRQIDAAIREAMRHVAQTIPDTRQ